VRSSCPRIQLRTIQGEGNTGSQCGHAHKHTIQTCANRARRYTKRKSFPRCPQGPQRAPTLTSIEASAIPHDVREDALDFCICLARLTLPEPAAGLRRCERFSVVAGTEGSKHSVIPRAQIAWSGFSAPPRRHTSGPTARSADVRSGGAQALHPSLRHLVLLDARHESRVRAQVLGIDPRARQSVARGALGRHLGDLSFCGATEMRTWPPTRRGGAIRHCLSVAMGAAL